MTARVPAPSQGEEALIAEFFAPLSAGARGALGLRDDCAFITPPVGCDLVVKTDPVRAGVHFFADDAPADIAWKALAVNISDLAAKGARPLGYLLALSFPELPPRDWLRAFADGLGEAQTAFGCHLYGGDTDRAPGPLSIGVTVFGTVPTGRMIRRGGARPGDAVYVTGTIGDAHLGLALRRRTDEAVAWGLEKASADGLLRRYLRPNPRLALIDVLHQHANAAMDVSDGLVKDFDRLCRASCVAGVIAAGTVPLSAGARTVVARDAAMFGRLLTGGDDYEILCTVPENIVRTFELLASSAGVAVSRIGHIETGDGSRILDATGAALSFPRTGWDHLSA